MATVSQVVGPGALVQIGTVFPEPITIQGTNFPIVGWAFDAALDEALATEELVAVNYGSGNVTVIIDWYSRSGSTTGAVVWGAALSVRTPGDAQSLETDAFATENTATTTVNGTAKGPTRTTITVSNLDSLAADDDVVLRIRRIGSNGSDTMTGDAILRAVRVNYSDT